MKKDLAENFDEQVRKMLASDGQALGRVYIGWQKHGEKGIFQTQDAMLTEVSEKSDIPKGTVTSNFQIIKHLLAVNGERKPPSSTAQCRTFADRIKQFRKRSEVEIYEGTSSQIDEILKELYFHAENPQVLAEEKKKIQENAKLFKEKTGIYVYTYPHYHLNPTAELTDDTPARYYLKVGKTTRGEERISEQTTGMPEDPLPILFISGNYDTDFSKSETLAEFENKFHDHLEIIGHAKIQKRGGGKEWFISNKETIASIADLMGMKIQDFDDESQNDE